MRKTTSIFLILVALCGIAYSEEGSTDIDILQLDKVRLARPAGVKKLSLEETLSLGLSQNPTMVAASAQVEQARAKYNQTKSQKNPKLVLHDVTSVQPERSIDTSGFFTRIPRPANFPNRLVLVDPVTNQFGLSLQMLLTTFGKVENAIAAAFLQIDTEQASAEVVQLNLSYSIKEAFFEKLKADATVEATRLNLEVSKQSLSDTQALFEQGVMSRYDILQAQIEVTNAIETLAQNLTRVDQASAGLSEVLAEQRFYVQPDPPPPPVVDDRIQPQQLLNFARTHRPELKMLACQHAVAEKLLKAAKGENRPELVLAAGYQTAFGQSLSPTDVTALTLQIQWQMYDGGYRKAKIQEAESLLEQLSAQQSDVTNKIQAQVEQLWLQLAFSNYQLNTARVQLEATEEYYDMARQRYINGLATTLELSDSLRNLVAARSALVNAQYDRELVFAQLEQALGADVPERKLTTEFLTQEFTEEKLD